MSYNSDHFKQPDSRDCVLYTFANALCLEDMIHQTHLLDEDGGGCVYDIEDFLKELGYKFKPLFYSYNESVHLKDKSIFFKDDFLNQFQKTDAIPLLCGVKGNSKNHMFTCFYYPYTKVFAVVDSLKDFISIYLTYQEFLNEYKIFELYYLTDLEGRTGFDTSNIPYLSEVYEFCTYDRKECFVNWYNGTRTREIITAEDDEFYYFDYSDSLSEKEICEIIE